MWIRVAYFDVMFNCCYEGNPIIPKNAIYENIRYLKKYIRRARIPLEQWAIDVSNNKGTEISIYACKELDSSFDTCYVDISNLRYSEVMIPTVKPPVKVLVEPPIKIPVPEKVEIPERLQGIIAHIQQELYEAETYDEKLALRNEAVALLIRSGIDKEDAMKLIKMKVSIEPPVEVPVKIPVDVPIKPPVKVPVKIPVPVKVKIPERIQGIIAHVQQELYEAETFDEKLALKNEAVALLIRQGINKEDAMKLIKFK